jgi:hypothetical protein
MSCNNTNNIDNIDIDIDIEQEIQSIRDTVNLLKQFINTDDFKEMKNNNNKEYQNYLIQIFPTFYEMYPTLFSNIIENKDLTFLESMLEGIIKINENKDLKDNIEKDLGEKLAEKYLYPNIKK